MKAILLAAGRGTRIARNVEMVPKSTLPIDGEPLIRRSVALLQKAGMQCIVCTGYKEEKVKEALEGMEKIHIATILFLMLQTALQVFGLQEKRWMMI